MRYYLVFLVVLIVSLRTFMYGIWTIRSRNAVGGIFIILMACGALGMAARYVFTELT
ncbi:MAG: hypothetical protein PUE13_02295 [Clostridiales bacterium]|nr:hypothetical protein [Clostridiales bacterium]